MQSELYSVYAGLYDAAFDWEVGDQVGAITGLCGLSAGRVLEPMCGSGRLLRAFAEQGFTTVGVDSSREMLALAEAHYDRGGLKSEWLCSDVTEFDLDEACDLAVCPINSLQHLPSAAAMGAHLRAVARNLYSGASYWVQLDLNRHDERVGDGEEWEFEYLGETVRIEWSASARRDGFETHLTRFVFPDGRVIDERQQMKVWSFDDWMALLDPTPFELSAAYRGDNFEPLPLDARLNGMHVIWQQLVKLR